MNPIYLDISSNYGNILWYIKTIIIRQQKIISLSLSPKSYYPPLGVTYKNSYSRVGVGIRGRGCVGVAGGEESSPNRSSLNTSSCIIRHATRSCGSHQVILLSVAPSGIITSKVIRGHFSIRSVLRHIILVYYTPMMMLYRKH